jgi:hypothetical protein
MAALIARLDVDEVDWVGTSLGGHIGMEIAARSTAPIRRLVLNDFGARIPVAALQRIGAYLAARHVFATLEEVEAYLRDVYAPFGELTDAQWRHMTVHGVVQDKSGFRLHYDPGHRRAVLAAHAARRRALARVGPRDVSHAHPARRRVRSPARLDRRRDDATRRRAREGRVEYVEIAGCGHAPSLMSEDQAMIVADFPVRQRCAGEARRARQGDRVKNKIVSTAEAVAIIRDGDTVAFSGFVGSGTPEELIAGLQQRFLETGTPRGLTLLFAAAPGDGKERGLNRLAHEGSSSARSAVTGASCRSCRRSPSRARSRPTTSRSARSRSCSATSPAIARAR